MNKLRIIGRTNEEQRFTLRIKTSDTCIERLNRLLLSIDENFLIDDKDHSRPLTPYEQWIDEYFFIRTNNYEVDVFCGKNVIHLVWNKYPSREKANKKIEEHAEWKQEEH